MRTRRLIGFVVRGAAAVMFLWWSMFDLLLCNYTWSVASGVLGVACLWLAAEEVVR